MRLYVDELGKGCYDQRDVDKVIAAKDAEIAALKAERDALKAKVERMNDERNLQD